MNSGQIDESARLYEALLAEAPAEPFARFGLGRIAAIQEQHERAVAHLQRAVELVPEWGEAYYALAMSFAALGRRGDASAALRSHTRFGTTVPGLEDPILLSTTSLRDDAVTRLVQGVKRKASGDLAGAIEAHEAAVSREPAYAQAHANLISLYSEAANWAQVEEHYRVMTTR